MTQAWWKFDTQIVRIREHDAPHRFVFDAATTSGKFVFEYLLEEIAAGRTAVRSTLSGNGLTARIAGYIGGGAMETQLHAEASQLRDHCESTTPTTPRTPHA